MATKSISICEPKYNKQVIKHFSNDDTKEVCKILQIDIKIVSIKSISSPIIDC